MKDPVYLTMMHKIKYTYYKKVQKIAKSKVCIMFFWGADNFKHEQIMFKSLKLNRNPCTKLEWTFKWT